MTPDADDLCVFAAKRGNISNRFDVRNTRYSASSVAIKQEKVTLGSLTSEEPCYGTSATAVVRTDESQPKYADTRIRLNYLYRRIIAPLRDAGVILASSSQGYKIPVSVEDITTYINQTHTVVSPMLHRIGICRNLIKQQTNNDLDVLDDPAFLKYKNYFD